MNPSANAKSAWPEAMATVTACKYEFGAGRALAFGIPTIRHFRISFNYWATGTTGAAELHDGEFTSEKYLPQGHLFPITYNPEHPHENSRSVSEPATSSPLFVIGVIGSLVLSLAWFAILRGCH